MERPGLRPSDGITREGYLMLAAELETELQERVLKFWFPRAVDRRRGGFFQRFRADGTLADHGRKFLVFQARMTWLASAIALRCPDRGSEYLDYARHGLDFLEHSMWDAEAGGLFWELDATARPAVLDKHAYGIAFAIFAAAGVARATGDARAISLAERTFDWLDTHAYDRAHGGYCEALTREGKPIVSRGAESKDMLGTICGRKSMNAHLHILEALIELYRAAPSAKHRRRLQEAWEITRDRIIHPDGYLQLYFEPDWRPVTSQQSFGHDLEVAFLLHEAADALGTPLDERTRVMARKLVDHALARGFDAAHGGFYNAAPLGGEVTDSRKVWWVQAEGLNALVAMHERYGAQSGYFAAFCKTWGFIAQHMSDHAYGEWWGYRGPRGEPLSPHQPKGHRWKAGYHDGRALLVSAEKLRRLAQGAPPAASRAHSTSATATR